MVHIAIPEPTSPQHVPDSTAYNLQARFHQYLHALHSAGATPIPIPLHESPQRVAKILSTCHGILLPGSPADIDPQKYAEPEDCFPLRCARSPPRRRRRAPTPGRLQPPQAHSRHLPRHPSPQRLVRRRPLSRSPHASRCHRQSRPRPHHPRSPRRRDHPQHPPRRSRPKSLSS